MIEVQLTASDFQLELYVEGYEFPDYCTGRDGNALACEIELDLTRRLDLHAARSQLILYTFELASFAGQLRALEHADGEAALGDPDPQSGDEFGLAIGLNHEHGSLDGFLADSTTTRITFERIDIDRSFIRDTLTQLAAILNAYPVRGDPAAD